MNPLNPLTSDVLGTASNIFTRSMQTAQEWAGYAIRYLKQTPDMLAKNPTAAIAVIATANTLFFFIMNAAVNRAETRFADPENKTGERSYKQIIIGESLAAGSVLTFNILLSLATRAQLDHVAYAAITATAVALRLFLNHFVYKQAEKVLKNDAKQATPVQEKKEPLDLEKVLADSPEKPPIGTQPSRLEISQLKADYAKEKLRADTLQGEKSGIESQIADLELEIEKLKVAQEKLEDEKKEILKELSDSQEKIESLQEEKNKLESQQASLEEQVAGLKSSFKEAEETISELEKKLADLEEKIQKEREVMQEKADQLEKDLSNEKSTAKAEKGKLDERIDALAKELKQSNGDKDQLEKDLQALQQKTNRELDDLKDQKSKITKEKQLADSELASANKKAAAAVEEMKKAMREKTRMEGEKNLAYERAESLEDEAQQLETHLDFQRDVNKSYKTAMEKVQTIIAEIIKGQPRKAILDSLLKAQAIKVEMEPSKKVLDDEEMLAEEEPVTDKPTDDDDILDEDLLGKDVPPKPSTPKKSTPKHERGRTEERGTEATPRSKSVDSPKKQLPGRSHFTSTRKPFGGVALFGMGAQQPNPTPLGKPVAKTGGEKKENE